MEDTSKETAPSSGQPLSGQGVLRIPRCKTNESGIRVATWNVKSLFAAGKFDNMIQEAKRLQVDIMGVSEVRWPSSGSCRHPEGTFFYSGGDTNDTGNRNGVGIFVTKEYSKYVTCFTPISDRIIMIQLQAKPFNINIIQIYMPTSDKKYDNDIELMYDKLTKLLNSLKSNEMNLLIGDFNAKVGQGRRSDLVGDFGLGESNERGDRLFEFCQTNSLIVGNTWFKLPKRRLYTWRSPADTPENPIRNQIDYILVNKRFRNCLRRVAAYPGADIGSDHNPLVTNLKIRLKVIKSSAKPVRLETSKLRNPHIKDTIATDLNDRMARVNIRTGNDVNEAWRDLKILINNISDNHLKPSNTVKKKRWITDEILALMDQRRIIKHDKNQYNVLQRRIRNEIKLAKENWMRDMCEEMEEYTYRHDSFNMHRKLKEVAGLFKRRPPMALTDNSNKLIIEEGKIHTAWENYVSELFEDERPHDVELTDSNDLGPLITQSEVKHAINLGKNGKAVGPDNIPIEIVKLIDDNNIKQLVELFNRIYLEGNLPDDWLKSTFIPLPKKQHPKKCSDYRLISIMSHLLKTFLRVIHARIRAKCELDLDKAQFGFRHGFGTREALFAVNVLLQKCRDQRKDVFACFIDYEKAFDRVQHKKLFEVLQRAGIDYRDIRILKNLYWNQTANVKISGKTTNNIKINRGVRQGCILSPLLFNLYSDIIFKKALEETDIGIKINGLPINNLRYADDTLVMAENIEDLQKLLTMVNRASEEMGLNINVSKTKFMIFSRSSHENVQLELNLKPIERVRKFKYLGSYITEDLNPDTEIKCRIEAARTAFFAMKSLFCNKFLDISLRQRMVKCYIWSVLLYGVESWTLKISALNRIEGFEMWTLRRMLRISWTTRTTNEEVLRRARTDRHLITNIKRRKVAYLGHVMRGEKFSLLRTIMEGKIEGKRGVGRKQMSWLRNVRDWTGIRAAGELFRLAEDRDTFAQVVANVS